MGSGKNKKAASLGGLCSLVMFSGVKSKLQQWRQKKKPTKLMEFPSKDTIRQIAEKNREQLQTLSAECKSIIQQLKDQVLALSTINEDTTAVTEKIISLEDNHKAIEIGLKISEEFIKGLEFTSLLGDEINKCSKEIKVLHNQASSLVKENKVLRRELSGTQDQFWQHEAKSAELEVQVEHLKFMNSLPVWTPFMDPDDKTQNLDSTEKLPIDNPKDILPFLDEDDSIDYAGPYILSLLDSLNISEKRLKIFLDLIKSYIQKEAFEIAIPLLKTTVEDLKAEHDSYDKIVFLLTEAIAVAYCVTKRYSEAIQVQTEIKRIRNEWMPEDNKGLAKTMSSLAVLNGKIGNSKKARKFCELALDLKNKVYGEKDIEVAKELHNLGVLYFYDGLHSKAIDYLVRAISTFESSTEKSVFSSARCSANLASMKMETGQHQEAQTKFLQVLETLNNHLNKLLQGTNLSKEEILYDQYKIEDNFNGEDSFEIKRVVQLAAEVKGRIKKTHE